jgi:uncharacterized protein
MSSLADLPATPGRPPRHQRPLAGARGWLVTDGKQGMDVQVRGVADALGLDYSFKQVSPHGLYRLLAPWGPVSPVERFGKPGSPFAPPFPDIALATGRLSIPYMRALARHAGLRTFRVVLQDPKTSPRIADLIWVPTHDKRRGANVVTTLTSPHSFSPERLARLRGSEPPVIAELPHPRIAIVLGGPGGAYDFGSEAIARLARLMESLAPSAGSFLVTPSRRTPPELSAAIEAATRGRPRLIWDGTGANPYPDILAHADAFVVTGDSVNMTGEACATGCPVYVFQPGRGSAKFQRFHDGLRRHGATRALPETLSRIEVWTYAPLHSAEQIAAEIERRWLNRWKMLRGIVHSAS